MNFGTPQEMIEEERNYNNKNNKKSKGTSSFVATLFICFVLLFSVMLFNIQPK